MYRFYCLESITLEDHICKELGTVIVDIVRVNADTRHQRTRTVPLKEKERTRTTFMKHGMLSGSNYWSIFKFHLSNASINWHTDNQDHWTVFSGLQKSTSFIYIRQREKGRLTSQRFKVLLHCSCCCPPSLRVLLHAHVQLPALD